MRIKTTGQAVTIAGVEAIKRAFRELEPKVAKKIARQSLRAGLSILRQAARSNAPAGETGNLRRAIKIKTAKRRKDTIRLWLRIGKGVPYGGAVEYGTDHQDGQHFMQDTFDSHGEEAMKVMEETGLRLLIEALKGR